MNIPLNGGGTTGTTHWISITLPPDHTSIFSNGSGEQEAAGEIRAREATTDTVKAGYVQARPGISPNDTVSAFLIMSGTTAETKEFQIQFEYRVVP